MNQPRMWIAAVVVVLGAAAPSSAQFATFDGANLLQNIQQVRQALVQVQVMRQQVLLAQEMAQQIRDPRRFRVPVRRRGDAGGGAWERARTPWPDQVGLPPEWAYAIERGRVTDVRGRYGVDILGQVQEQTDLLESVIHALGTDITSGERADHSMTAAAAQTAAGAALIAEQTKMQNELLAEQVALMQEDRDRRRDAEAEVARMRVATLRHHQAVAAGRED